MKQPRITSYLNILQEEEKLVGLVLAHAILLYISNVLARTSAYTLFLVEYDAATLPYIYISIGLTASAISFIYLRLGQRLPLNLLVLGNLISVLLTFALVRIGLAISTNPLLIFVLPVWFGVVNALNITGFWELAGRLFTLRQGKRLFGLLGAGEHIATVITGFSVPFLILWVGTDNLVLLGAIILSISIVIYLYLTRAYASLFVAEESTASVSVPKSRTTKSVPNPYVLLLYALFGLFVVGIYFVDNLFYGLAEWRFPDEGALGSFIGVFFGLVGALSLFVQIFVSGRLLERFGVRVIMLATPVAMAIGMALILLSGYLSGITIVLFWLASITNLFRLVMDGTDNAAVNVLFQPLPARLRRQTQTTVNGIIYPAGIGIAGALLLVLNELLHLELLAIGLFALVVIALWLAAAVMLGREYPKMVLKALAARYLGTSRLPGLDAESLALLRRQLQDPYPEAVIYALNRLEENAPDILATELTPLLAHPSPEVRQESLKYLGYLNQLNALPAIRELIVSGQNAAVLGQALITLAQISPDDSVEVLSGYLDHPQTKVQKGALLGLLSSKDKQGQKLAEDKLLHLSRSSIPEERRLAADVVCTGGVSVETTWFGNLFDDEDREVRRTAIFATSRLQNHDLWGKVIDAVDDRAVSGVAVAALTAGGKSILPAIALGLKSYEGNLYAETRLIEACGRIGGDEAIAILEPMLDQPNATLREAILAALQQCDYHAGNDQRNALVERQIGSEVASAAWLLACIVDINEENEADSAGSILNDALSEELHHCRLRVLHLLSFQYSRENIGQIERTLAGDSAQQRSYAVEALDILLPVTMARQVLPLFEAHPPQDRLRKLQSLHRQQTLGRNKRLAELAQVGNGQLTTWSRACAIYDIGDKKIDELVDIVREATTSNVPLIAETARQTLIKLNAQPPSLHPPHDVSLLPQPTGDQTMLSIIERVIILKTVNIFANTPDDILADVAQLLDEVEVEASEPIFAKGDAGDSMYIIVSGKMRVHDGDLTFNTLEQRDVFGEMALLASEPRSASITAQTNSVLLRLDQGPFHELLESRSEVALGIISLLSKRLLTANRTLTELQNR